MSEAKPQVGVEQELKQLEHIGPEVAPGDVEQAELPDKTDVCAKWCFQVKTDPVKSAGGIRSHVCESCAIAQRVYLQIRVRDGKPSAVGQGFLRLDNELERWSGNPTQLETVRIGAPFNRRLEREPIRVRDEQGDEH
jgi:hypothetical protein